MSVRIANEKEVANLYKMLEGEDENDELKELAESGWFSLDETVFDPDESMELIMEAITKNLIIADLDGEKYAKWEEEP